MDSEAFDKLREKIRDKNAPSTLFAWIENASARELFRINPILLAERIDIDADRLLAFFLMAVHDGAFDLSWEFHCPHCNAVPDFHHNLSEAKGEGFCPLCDVSFRNTLDSNVEVTFTVHPSILDIPEPIRDEYRNKMIAEAREKRYTPETPYLSGLRCLNNAVFQELFGNDLLSVEESLQIRSIALLFTDIKDSTQMYTDLGDTRSYDIVREHFKILFDSIEKNRGFVVKTIGDAVMGSFMTALDAMNAAVQAHERFGRLIYEGPGRLNIKMGIHTGSVIAVNMNDRIDYFGNVVNTAARIESKAQGHSVCFSREVFDQKDVKRFLKKKQDERGAEIRHSTVSLKGIEGKFELYTLRIEIPTLISF